MPQKVNKEVRDAVIFLQFVNMDSLVKLGFKSFFSKQIQKVYPLQVLSNHFSSNVWTPPEKLNVSALKLTKFEDKNFLYSVPFLIYNFSLHKHKCGLLLTILSNWGHC